jgi:hypothetical protein
VVRYVTHDGYGNLTGCYLQDIPVGHAASAVICTEQQAAVWTSLRWNGEQLVAIPPAPPVVVVPQRVTRRQGMAVLLKYGHDAQIEDLLNTQLEQAQDSEDAEAVLAARFAINDWKNAAAFDRTWPLIAQMQGAFNWTDAYVDGLFIEAATL